METRQCQNCKNEFTIEPDDFSFYQKINVPPPTFCPECRRQRRLAWRNDLTLYNRTCDLCNKPVVALYSKESQIIVYCNKCWWGDGWDPIKYSRDYDFSRSFFEQFVELQKSVPHLALINDDGIGSINCEYTQDFAFAKNCYMVFIAWKIENVLYSSHITAGKDMMDCIDIRSNNEWLYECRVCAESYWLKYSYFSKACLDSQFLLNCIKCSDCFMCSGIVGKKYNFKNKQYTKEEYEKILASYRLDTYEGTQKAQKEFENFVLTQPVRCNFIMYSKDCTGDVISNSKNSKNCFVVKKCENSKYVNLSIGAKDSYDMATGGELSECYEDITCDHSNRNLFGIFSWKCQDVLYTENCHNSQSVFGSIGLKNKQYCILNKQYSKKEYEELTSRIIRQMSDVPYIDARNNVYKFGEFYPIELSPFGYNETIAMEQFSLTKDQALEQGYNWQDNTQHTTGKGTLLPENIPESIHDITDSILSEILVCVECKRNYKIVPNELIFYKKMTLPVPRKCFYCRYNARVQQRNPFKLWKRTCMCGRADSPQTTVDHDHSGTCSNEFETSYAPDRKEIVYCEKCYQAEMW